MITYTYKEWLAEGVRLFGADMKNWKFRCCNCGHVQSIKDFEAIGVKDPEAKVYFSCIGRWLEASGTILNSASPCNYTLGGLLSFAQVQIVINEQMRPVFDFAKEPSPALL